MRRKRFSMLFLFNFVPQKILNFFLFHFVKLIVLNSSNKSSSKSDYISRTLCILFTSSFASLEIKTCGLVQQLILGMHRDLCNFQSLNGNLPLIRKNYTFQQEKKTEDNYINLINMVDVFANLQMDFIFLIRNYWKKKKDARNILLLQTNDKR